MGFKEGESAWFEYTIDAGSLLFPYTVVMKAGQEVYAVVFNLIDCSNGGTPEPVPEFSLTGIVFMMLVLGIGSNYILKKRKK